MDVGYSIGTLHEGFHEMATIPDNVPEIPEVPGFQESAYKGLESMSEPGKLREWYVGRSDRDSISRQLRYMRTTADPSSGSDIITFS